MLIFDLWKEKYVTSGCRNYLGTMVEESILVYLGPVPGHEAGG